MNTLTNLMATQLKKQLWIGMVEVRALESGSNLLDGMKGAFVNIVTWASDAEEFKRNTELVIRNLGGLFVAEVVNSEPIEVRRTRTKGGFEEEIEDMISRAQDNPKAIIYGTFHTFKKDDA
jgi:hypothetical protein